ncbi:MAG TPA: hypothetical protein VLE95_04895 [Chlamydiales bacterium]|nr:hypothetical protein [Chlamydiales bacterium]
MIIIDLEFTQAVLAFSINDPNHHFVGADNPITSGKGRIQMVKDYHLSGKKNHRYQPVVFAWLTRGYHAGSCLHDPKNNLCLWQKGSHCLTFAKKNGVVA